MSLKRLAACPVVFCLLAGPAWAQAPAPTENGDTVAAVPDGGQGVQLPPVARTTPVEVGAPEGSSNIFKLAASDFRNFFSLDTALTMGYASVAAVAAAPWDREGVNNGFNIPTTLFQSGNLIGQFAFQLAAGGATYGIAKATGNDKLSMVGRDIIRAQVVSQVMVQALKHTIRRERPDASNSAAFPSGHAASAFATAAVLQRHYGWKIGVPAYALGGYVSLARMAWNKHHATDVVMGAGFGIASARTVTMSVAKTKFSVGVQPERGGASIQFSQIRK
jgi:membrane-associated phospholipid phosphatase